MHFTNVSLFAFLLPALSSTGCAVHQFADGTVSYTSTPAVAEQSGALPLRPLVCIDGARVRETKHTAGVLLGSCQLAGVDNPHRGRGMVSGGETELRPVGSACELPTQNGSIALHVTNASLQYEGEGVNVTVGGTTSDGRYVTYRFTGMFGDSGPSGACNALLDAPPAS